ncbi:MAG: hypothetical protein ACYTGH_12970 [Planctomycetota bacterium]|jgi:hypothetical protein
MKEGKRRSGSILLRLTLFALLTLSVPRWYCGQEASSAYDDIQAADLIPPAELLATMGKGLSGKAGEESKAARAESQAHLRNHREAILPLARGVASIVERGVTTADFTTGSRRFDGEWQFGTYHMAGIGLAQVLKAHPQIEERARFLSAIETCIEKLLTDEVKVFDTEAWNEDPIESLDGDRGHAAYLGYFNLTLGLYREVAKTPKFNAIHDRITAALVRRLKASPLTMLQTYPGEMYPVDNAAVIAGIAQHGRVTRTDYNILIQRWGTNCRSRHVDPTSGLLIQAISSRDGSALDAPRASGTALGLFFISFADHALSATLYKGIKSSCATDWGGFGLVREYPPNVPQGTGDIDSGPVVLGMSFSGTGFSVAGSRIHRDAEFFEKLYRTVYLFGAPNDHEDERTFVTGGPLGNAIMLAMLTAQPTRADRSGIRENSGFVTKSAPHPTQTRARPSEGGR